MYIMGSILIYDGMPPLTDEQLKEIEELDKRKIDLSDIPEITDEEIKKFKPARLRRKKLQVAS